MYGGQLKLVESVFVLILLGFPGFSFTMNALKKLYYAKTADKTLLVEPCRS